MPYKEETTDEWIEFYNEYEPIYIQDYNDAKKFIKDFKSKSKGNDKWIKELEEECNVFVQVLDQIQKEYKNYQHRYKPMSEKPHLSTKEIAEYHERLTNIFNADFDND